MVDSPYTLILDQISASERICSDIESTYEFPEVNKNSSQSQFGYV